MNPPSGPPPPPPNDPRETFLHDFKGEIIAMMLHYKAGMFRGKINWSVRLVDFFDVLLQSPALDTNERILFARLAWQIGILKSIADSGNKPMGDATWQEHRQTMQTLRAVVDVEKAARGRNSLTQSLRNAGFNNLSFEAGINVAAGRVVSTRREEYAGPELISPQAASQNQQMDTTLPSGMQAASGDQPTYTELLSGMQTAAPAPGSHQLPTFDNQNAPPSGHPHFPPGSMVFHSEGTGNIPDPLSAADNTNSVSAGNAGDQWQIHDSLADDWLARAWQMGK